MESAHSFNSNNKNVKTKFSPGHLVFAKMKGYPAWPARIQSVVSGKQSDTRYSVFFFGTHDSTVCTEKYIFPYAETKGLFGKPLKYKGFQQALDEIEQAASLLEQESKAAECMKVKSVRVVVQRIEESTDHEVRAYLTQLKEDEQSLKKSLMNPQKKPPASGNFWNRQNDNVSQDIDPIMHDGMLPGASGGEKRRKILQERDQSLEVSIMHPEEDPPTRQNLRKRQRYLLSKEEDSTPRPVKIPRKSRKVKRREENVKPKFSRGHLVFAKVKGYPPWPAQVENVVAETPNCIKYSVCFFGTYNSSICTDKNIFSYTEMKHQFGRPLKYAGFQRALDEIKEVASVLEQENVKSKFSPGNLVFAKMKGYPAWPAQVQNVVSQKPGYIRYSVYFFGTGNVSVCSENKLFPYAETKQQYGKPLKYTRFQQALDEIYEASLLFKQVIKEEPGLYLQMRGVSSFQMTQLRNKQVKIILEDCSGSIQQSSHQQNYSTPRACSSPKNRTEICRICGNFFKNASKLSLHFQNHPGERPFKCRECNVQFDHKDRFQHHIETHTTKKKLNKCQSTHIVKKHMGFRTSKDTLCPAVEPIKQNSVVPMRAEPAERQYKCSVCHKTFNKWYMKIHARIHTNEKPHECEQCGARFSQKSNLNKHVYIHTKVKPFKCIKCDKLFSEIWQLRKHDLMSHTSAVPRTCSYCGIVFKMKKYLLDHVSRCPLNMEAAPLHAGTPF